jgi:hypothetical protein
MQNMDYSTVLLTLNIIDPFSSPSPSLFRRYAWLVVPPVVVFAPLLMVPFYKLTSTSLDNCIAVAPGSQIDSTATWEAA